MEIPDMATVQRQHSGVPFCRNCIDIMPGRRKVEVFNGYGTEDVHLRIGKRKGLFDVHHAGHVITTLHLPSLAVRK